MHRDTVIGIVGVVILVAAMVGVFSYERNQAAGLNGTGGELTTVSGPTLSETTAVGATSEQVLALNQTGMTNVTFTLTWSAANGVDTLQLVVVPPAGSGLNETQSEPESDGSISFTVPVPNTGADGQLGVGDWQVSVAFVSAETNLPQQPPVGVPGTTDEQVAWELETSIQAYAAP